MATPIWVSASDISVLGSSPHPFTAKEQQKPSLKKTAKVTLKGLRCVNHGASLPRGWDLTVECPASPRPCQDVWSQSQSGQRNPILTTTEQPSPWFYLKETHKNAATLILAPTPPLLPSILERLFFGHLFLHGFPRLVPALKPSAWKASIPTGHPGLDQTQ